MIRRLRLDFTAVFLVFLLCISILIVNIAQTLSFIFVKPFSGKAFRKVNWFCANTYWNLLVVCYVDIQGVRIRVTGDSIPDSENAIVIGNHQAMADIMFLLYIGRSCGRLGDMKWFAKDILKYVPGIGWGIVFLDCLLVKRNWTKDQASVEATFRKYIENKTSLWLISFLEGTRKTPQKLAASQAFAKKNGLPVLSHVLNPRTKGFVASVQGLKNHLHAVYDVTIDYPGPAPALLAVLTNRIGEVHLHVKRYEIQTLPQDEQKLAQWVNHLFQEKDQLLETFHQSRRHRDSLVPLATKLVDIN